MDLFFRDNHSADSISLEPAAAHISADIVALLKLNYSALFQSETEFNVETIGGANINSLNYRINKNYYLKFLPSQKAGLKPEIYPQLADQLRNCGFNSADFYPTEGGEKKKYGIIKNSDFLNGEHYFFLQDFISELFYTGIDKEAIKVPGLVLKLENVFSESSGWTDRSIFQESTPFRNINLKADWEQIKQILEGRGPGNDPYLLQTISIIPELISKYFEINQGELDDLIELPDFGVYHSDLHPHNLLSDSSSNLWVIDHESFRFMPRIIYRGFSIFKLLRKSISTERCTLHFVQTLIRKTFSEDEIVKLKFGAQTELIRRILLILNLHFLSGDSRWNSDLVKHTAGIKEGDLLFSQAEKG